MERVQLSLIDLNEFLDDFIPNSDVDLVVLDSTTEDIRFYTKEMI